MKKRSSGNVPIPLPTAIAEAGHWRTYCKKLLGDEKLPVIKAFFVPLADLMEVVDLAKKDSGHEVAGLRLYFRLESEHKTLKDIKAMAVPVVYTDDPECLKDWVELQNTDSAAGSSLVFDFTKPCPTECDKQSPLF